MEDFVHHLNMIHESLNHSIKTLLFQKQMSFTVILDDPFNVERTFENKKICFIELFQEINRLKLQQYNKWSEVFLF